MIVHKQKHSLNLQNMYTDLLDPLYFELFMDIYVYDVSFFLLFLLSIEVISIEMFIYNIIRPSFTRLHWTIYIL